MKIDRQIGILSMLLQKNVLTAPVLAEQFEVSRRTINRDIEDLCKAGISVVTKQGVNGGISIMEGYKLDKTLFTHEEMQDILAGLRSLDSVNGSGSFKQQEDGKLFFQADYTNRENLITWLMSFRDKVELLEPKEIREEIRNSIACMKKKYEDGL